MWLENGSLILIRGVVHRMHWGETLISNPAKVIYGIANGITNTKMWPLVFWYMCLIPTLTDYASG